MWGRIFHQANEMLMYLQELTARPSLVFFNVIYKKRYEESNNGMFSMKKVITECFQYEKKGMLPLILAMSQADSSFRF